MKENLCRVLNRIYGICMTVSFFAGGLPLLPFLYAILVGGEQGAAISKFLYKQYYPWVILLASVAVIIGLIGMYVGKQYAFSVKDLKGEGEKK